MRGTSVVLLSFVVTFGWLFVVVCVAVATARVVGGEGLWYSRTATAVEKIIWGFFGFTAGVMVPALYLNLGLLTAAPPMWLSLSHGAIVLAGALLIIRLMTHIRHNMWSDELLTEFMGEVLPVVVTAQRRAAGDRGEGAVLVDEIRAALKAGRGRDAVRYAVRVRALVEEARLPEHAAWTKVSEQIVYWAHSHLPPRHYKALLDDSRHEGTLAS